MSRLRRFLHIERPRADEPSAPERARPETAERFGGVDRPRPAAAAPPATGAELERFGPEPPPRLELLETTAGERPFTRCMRCGMDHGVFATACTGCGASLDTAAQREFNERLWTRRQDEARREAAAAEELRALRARADAEAAQARRAMGEAIAREVGERERRRLDAEWGAGRRTGAPPLADLLRRVWRILTRGPRGGTDPAP
jgi:hypothetical protein